MRSVIPGVNFPTLDPCWLRMPSEQSTTFLPAFVRMSEAIQAVLRETVPVKYFEYVERFRDTRTAYPMLIYQASPVFRGKKRSELTYDVLNPALIAALYRRSKLPLDELLTHVEARLRTAGMDELANLYAPQRGGQIITDV